MAFQITANFHKNSVEGVIQYPNKILRLRSKRVTKIDENTRKVAKKLNKILRKVDRLCNPWLGMAAPQIGYNKRIIAVKESYHNYTIMINPEIKEQKWFLPIITSCFSLRGLYLTKCHYWFKIRYQDLVGKYHTRVLIGLKATLMQQEIDHLNGKLICD